MDDGFVMTANVFFSNKNADYDIENQSSANRDLLKVRNAFNTWHDETGFPYCHLAKIAAFSIGENYDNQYIQQKMMKFSSMICIS